MARIKAPADQLQELPGKALATEALVADQWAALTTDVVAVISATNVLWQRPWHEVATGEWDEDRHELRITWVDGAAPAVLSTVDDAPKKFPRVFKERVDSSVVYLESERIPAGGTLRAAIRRTPSGELISQISTVGKVQHTPALESQLESLERRLWEIVGL